MNFLKTIFKKRDRPIKSYEDFWTWFQLKEKQFFNAVKNSKNLDRDFFDPLSAKLNEINEGYFYVTGMFDDNTAELIFTAEGTVHNIIFVEELVQAAPKIDGWLFTSLKPPMDISDVNIELSDYKFNDENLSFYYTELPEYPDEVEITVVYQDFDENDRSTIQNGVYIFLDHFLGELNFATTVDNLTVSGPLKNGPELVPIEKLKDYLVWREKEFVEKYEGIRHKTDEDNYAIFEATLESGKFIVGVINTDLLSWDRKSSHPWILNIAIGYQGQGENGLPDEDTYKLMTDIEEKVMDELKDSEGYLNVGRETTENLREIYFACTDFRKPSKVLHKIKNLYSDIIEIKYDIYKDKYWRSFNRFVKY